MKLLNGENCGVVPFVVAQVPHLDLLAGPDAAAVVLALQHSVTHETVVTCGKGI